MLENLWGEEFKIEPKAPKIKKILGKANKKGVQITQPIKKITSREIPFSEKIALIEQEIDRILGKEKTNIEVIRDKSRLGEYVNYCISNGIVAIDTETNNSLDPITAKIIGLCLYSDGLKQAYIPINHLTEEGERVENQLTEEDIRPFLQQFVDNNTKTIFHNAKFDYAIIKETCDIAMPIYWDTIIGVSLLDETEKRTGLKDQYKMHIDPEAEKYSVDSLFENIEYAKVPIDLFAIYAATDSKLTLELFYHQYEELSKDENKSILRVAHEVEMPLTAVIAEMQLNGIEFDKEYSDLLIEKYTKELADIEKEVYAEIDKHRDKINAWKLTPEANKNQDTKKGKGMGKSKAEQLADPILLSSPTQLAILLYDILEYRVIDRRNPRGTGENILEALGTPLTKAIIKLRAAEKLVTSFLKPLPTFVHPVTGRVHCNFNQYGAVTGRFSSSEPNLQQIPRKNTEIRMMFKATDEFKIIEAVNGVYTLPEYSKIESENGSKFIGEEFSYISTTIGELRKVKQKIQNQGEFEIELMDAEGEGIEINIPYVLIGSDFSQQEPRLLSIYSQDETMLGAYKNGKDLYGLVASSIYHLPYEECLERDRNGNYSVDGAKRRDSVKSVLLGIMYGRQVKSIAEGMNCTPAEAKGIIDMFYASYPVVKKWMEQTYESARALGYVEDFWGRRRRLPDMQLENFSVRCNEKTAKKYFNPFLNCSNTEENRLVSTYKNKLNAATTYRAIEALKQEAQKDGLIVRDNRFDIAEAERKSVNARIQGGAATMTKIALIRLFNNEKLKQLKFRTLITIHDEIIGEAPAYYAEEAAAELSKVMSTSADSITDMVFKCDADISTCWYLNEYQSQVKKEYEAKVARGKDPLNAFNELCEERPESTREQMIETLEELLIKNNIEVAKL